MSLSRREFLSKTPALAAGAPVLAVSGAPALAGEAPGSSAVFPVGRVEAVGPPARVRILDPYVEALLGLEEWSHVNILYWFDRNDEPEKRRTLRVHPRGDPKNPLTGVFACRSPLRPNPIALTACRLVSVEGPVVTVEGLDAFEGTPILDLKPVIPLDLAPEDLRVPKWAAPQGGEGVGGSEKAGQSLAAIFGRRPPGGCAQRLFGAGLEYLGQPRELVAIASPFDGGMGLGETCGYYCAALMVVGLATAGVPGGRAEAAKVQKAFTEAWRKRWPLRCQEIREAQKAKKVSEDCGAIGKAAAAELEKLLEPLARAPGRAIFRTKPLSPRS